MNEGRRILFDALGAASRFLGWLLERWKLALVAVFFISPVGPHLRVLYTYSETSGQRFYVHCAYLGSRGIVEPAMGGDCPILTMIDTRTVKR